MTTSPEPGEGLPPFSVLVPVRSWVSDRSLRSWTVLVFIGLVGVPPIAIVLLNNPTMGHITDAAWIFAAYFALAWLLLLAVIVRPENLTAGMLGTVAAVGIVIEVPIALFLETLLHNSTSNLLTSIVTVGIPEELAKALPVLAVALASKHSHRLVPRDYLFLGAVSGLVFGVAEVVRYFTNYLVPAFLHVVQAQGTFYGADLQIFTVEYVWRFVADPISHACWAGITGYFIGLAFTRPGRGIKVGLIGLGIAAVLHGLNDWSVINGHAAWVAVIGVSVILFLGYARAEPAPVTVGSSPR